MRVASFFKLAEIPHTGAGPPNEDLKGVVDAASRIHFNGVVSEEVGA